MRLTRAQRRVVDDIRHGARIWRCADAAKEEDPERYPDGDPNARYLVALFVGDELAGTYPVQFRTLLALWRRGLIEAER